MAVLVWSVMANEVKLPRLGQGMESGTIIKWLKSEGDEVEKGEPLYELDTDKVTQEVEADVGGVLLRIAITEGEVPVGETIALIGKRGEQVSAPERKAKGEPEGEETGPAPPATETGTDDGAAESAEKPAEAPKRESERQRGREAFHEQIADSRASRGNGRRVKASPLARRIARERGIDIRALRGTGPEGRIVAEDVARTEAGAPATGVGRQASEIERRPLSSTRTTIARRLTEAWTIPAFQVSISADMGRAQSLQKRFRATEGEEAAKTTVTDILTKACASALMRHRAVNARFAEDAIELLPQADVGLAVAIPDGLVVPIIRAAERLTIAELAAARADLVTRARERKLRRGELEGGSFTISNLGMYGVDQFVAVLNPPQAAILAVGAIEERVVVRDGEVAIAPQLMLTLTCDHRTIDGATASEFLGTVKAFLEEPGLML